MSEQSVDEMIEEDLAYMHEPDLAIVHPGQYDWFPVEDWMSDAYLFEGPSEVWCSLMMARTPGSGAFSRLVSAIHAQGKCAVVPCPIGQMQAILAHKGFLAFPDDTWRKKP